MLNASDLSNYNIEDTNQENQKNDLIYLKKVEYDGNTIIRMYTEGITSQPKERYIITLQNLQDQYGNIINPNPQTVTVVQRFDK